MAVDLNIGNKVKALRLASDLTQVELANRSGLTKGFISQLENEQSSISVDSLVDILDVLGVSLAEFFSDTAEAPVVFSPHDRTTVDSRGVEAYEILVPGSTNNMMDPHLVQLAPGESLDPQQPFAGEQFGFVLKGTATLTLNKKTHRIPRHHCYYFRADRMHQLSNRGSGAATVLLVTTPPQM